MCALFCVLCVRVHCVCVRVCMRVHACMYVCMYACMYVCMYACAGTTVLLTLLACYPVINLVPLASLAGVMFMIVYHTCDWASLWILLDGACSLLGRLGKVIQSTAELVLRRCTGVTRQRHVVVSRAGYSTCF